ncbi:DUF1254 domain-containing protein [Iamia sp. SCSIO 61187]|uniref:DUF1254 domain-containing protein n=1 Tax=Iamia sp. SCSIO 61187 TaxID=2722752 RepID=UPI001C633FA2|nr:DUF1254 domain-containing protein [Iamia sp. SCSIO 61187]QYG92499.1 DUF1254 domain-containing protein [Iamia sp. SCSIO 61187]
MARRRLDLEALVDGVVWGYPLLATRRTLHRSVPVDADGLALRTRLSTAADRGVVAPNNDTLYGSGFYDLAEGDLTIEVPPLEPGRYWSVMLLDAYTSVSYVCRRLHGSDGVVARATLDPTVPPVRDGATTIPVATPSVWVLARVVVDGPHDVAAATDALRSIRVTGPGHGAAGADGPPSDPLALVAEALASDPPAPWDVPAPPGLAGLLDEGIAAGAGPEVLARVHERVLRLGHDRIADGWGTRLGGADFGSDVVARAATARFALAAHLPAENRSYVAGIDDGAVPRRLRFRPEDLPPVRGFWSLTMYGVDGQLVDNPIDRYSIGDRTPGVEREPDGSLVIDVGADPPARTTNWLPAPPGPCAVALRAYEGHPEVVGAAWFPPPLTPAP